MNEIQLRPSMRAIAKRNEVKYRRFVLELWCTKHWKYERDNRR